jgi:response regulator RpfG family c-di-GMP phosphodiesterase
MLIFVVDDHELMRNAVTGMLRRIKKTAQVLEFECFVDLQEAVEVHVTPDLLVFDLTLPRIFGYGGVRRTPTCCQRMRLAVC